MEDNVENLKTPTITHDTSIDDSTLQNLNNPGLGFSLQTPQDWANVRNFASSNCSMVNGNSSTKSVASRYSSTATENDCKSPPRGIASLNNFYHSHYQAFLRAAENQTDDHNEKKHCSSVAQQCREILPQRDKRKKIGPEHQILVLKNTERKSTVETENLKEVDEKAKKRKPELYIPLFPKQMIRAEKIDGKDAGKKKEEKNVNINEDMVKKAPELFMPEFARTHVSLEEIIIGKSRRKDNERKDKKASDNNTDNSFKKSLPELYSPGLPNPINFTDMIRTGQGHEKTSNASNEEMDKRPLHCIRLPPSSLNTMQVDGSFNFQPGDERGLPRIQPLQRTQHREVHEGNIEDFSRDANLPNTPGNHVTTDVDESDEEFPMDYHDSHVTPNDGGVLLPQENNSLPVATMIAIAQNIPLNEIQSSPPQIESSLFGINIFSKSNWIFYSVALTSITIVMAFIIIYSKVSTPTHTTEFPTPGPFYFYKTRAESITNILIQTSGKNVLKEGTAQMNAMNWIIEEDTMKISADSPYLLQRYSLMVLYHSTSGHDWRDREGWGEGLEECLWFGVEECEDGYLVGLDLESNKLNGTIPDEIGLLSSLYVLKILRNRELSGTIPSSIGMLTNLKLIHLISNSISGTIPSTIGNIVHLEELSLSYNFLTGTISPFLGNLSRLIDLQLNHNKLTGIIPSILGNLIGLEYLVLWDNNLSGEIPKSLTRLKSLIHLILDVNSLNGTIPSAIGELGHLEALFLAENKLTGPIPDSIGSLTLLKHLYLDYNMLHSTIPKKLGNLVELEKLDLGHNLLSGSIPTTMCTLSKIFYLYFANNNLDGSIPTQTACLQSLQSIHLWMNNLSGKIPSSLGNDLVELVISQNKLTGSIPSSIGNLTALQYIILSDNELTGKISSSLGMLKNLVDLSIYNNKLTGPIPPNIGDLKAAKYIGLDENKLTGPIPSSLGRLSNLISLILSSNFISGEVPQAFINLTSLGELYLNDNNLTGNIDFLCDSLDGVNITADTDEVTCKCALVNHV